MSILAVHLSSTHNFSKTSQPSIHLLKGLGVKGDCHLGKTTQHLWRLNNHADEPNLRQVHLIQSELFDEPGFHGEDGARVEPGQMGENVTTTGIDLLALGKGTRLRFLGTTEMVERDQHEAGFVYMALGSAIGTLILKALIMTLVFGSLKENVKTFPWTIFIYALVSYAFFHGAHNETTTIDNQPAVVITGLRHPCKKVDAFRKGLLEKCMVKEGKTIVERKAGVMGVVEVGGTIRPGMIIVVEPTAVFEPMKPLY